MAVLVRRLLCMLQIQRLYAVSIRENFVWLTVERSVTELYQEFSLRAEQ